MASNFDSAYVETRNGLASDKFSSDGDWKKIIENARKLVRPDGLDAGKSSAVSDLRKLLSKAGSGPSEAAAYYKGAGESISGTGAGAGVGTDLAKRLAAIKTLRHMYMLKKAGSHKVWVLAIPKSFTDWPHEALKGGLGTVTAKLVDKDEHFSINDRKNLAHASQEGLKWVHKAMAVASQTRKDKNFEKVARWFADSDSKDSDVKEMANTLNMGLKKVASMLKSGSLIYTDSVSERGTDENAGTEAFVWGDKIDVVYIEEEFFGTQNTLTGLTNWARIVVHEITHREVDTKDHAYEHQGMAPKKITAARAIENADSWAWFCADCGGALTDNQIKNALER